MDLNTPPPPETPTSTDGEEQKGFIATPHELTIASLRAELAHFKAKDEELWRERLAVINGLGLMEAMDRGASFEKAVIEFGRNPDFIAGFKAARDQAATFASQQSLYTLPSEYAFAIRVMQPYPKEPAMRRV